MSYLMAYLALKVHFPDLPMIAGGTLLRKENPSGIVRNRCISGAKESGRQQTNHSAFDGNHFGAKGKTVAAVYPSFGFVLRRGSKDIRKGGVAFGHMTRGGCAECPIAPNHNRDQREESNPLYPDSVRLHVPNP
jgi:hypothetical protein